jgi:biotin transport system substrate-specific component
MTTTTNQQPLVPSLLPASLPRDLALVVGGSVLLAVLSQVSIPLPFVPITGQTLGVFLVALTLGWRLGGASVVLWLAYAVVGLPVLAEFKGGLATVVGPTGGYLLGFLIATLVAGWLADRGWTRNFALVALAMLIGTLLIYIPGLLWLSRFVGDKTLEYGLYPFWLGDTVKAALVTALLPSAWRFVRR